MKRKITYDESYQGTSLYAGTCPNCGKTLYPLIISPNGFIPPPMIKFGCSCSLPPTEVSCVYTGEKKEAA